ncbi:reverse transcriptase domain-containing protein [Tanacetum coccineum]
MTNERGITPPPSFSTLTPIPSSNELPPINVSTFTTRTPENTPLTNHASTSANRDPMISLAFVEANYKVLESLSRECRRRKRNEDLCTKLEYFSEEYDKEREMEPRPIRNRKSTPVLSMRSPRARRQRERMVDFEDIPNRYGSMVERNFEGRRPLGLGADNNGSQRMNLPTLLVAHLRRSENGQLLQSSLTFVNKGPQSSINTGGNLPPNDPTSCVTPFVHWIEDYPLLDRLKMPSYVGSYDGTRDPDNYLHLFEGAIRMQKWVMPVACHMFTYTLKDSARIWWNSQKAGSILKYEDLKAKFRSHFSQQKKFTKMHLAVHNIKQREGESTRAFVTRNLVEFLSMDLPTTYKGLMEKTYTWIEAREVATNGAPNDRREGFDRSRKNPSWDNNKGQKNRDRFFPYRGSNHGLLSNLSKSLREILATEKVVKTFEQPPRLPRSRRSWDMSKYCHFHEDYGHNTNQCQELRHQIKEPEKSGQLAHLVKGIKKESKDNRALKRKSVEESVDRVKEITFPPVSSINSSDPVIIKARISERQVSRVYMDSGSSCEVIYENCFLKLKPSIRTVMQRMGIVVYTIHGAIKFHTPRGIGTVFLTRKSDKAREEQKKLKGTPQKATKDILGCADTKETIVVNEEYLEQTIVIGRQLPTSFKMKLHGLLRANTDVFAWTYAHMK